MSRIGKVPINIPSGVAVNINNGIAEVKGPNSALSRQIPKEKIDVEVKDGSILVTRRSDSKKNKSLHGLTRMLINNMVTGVTEGFKKRLIIEGVGYKAALHGKTKLTLNLGFSKPVGYEAPEGISFEVIQNNEIVVKGADKELVGQVAVKIRSFRKPEPYKGKGIRYADEHIRRKAGKSTTGGTAKK